MKKSKVDKIENSLYQLEKKLKEYAREIGPVDFANKVNLKVEDISAWINKKRSFSYKKLLKIARIMEEK